MRSFWMTVILVELTDIAFAMDSILAAVAMTNQYWIIVTGALIGTVMMRFAAIACIRLLEKFPKLEDTAYILITIIGLKVIIEGFRINGVDFQSSHSPWFWAQWLSMAASIGYGFKKKAAT